MAKLNDELKNRQQRVTFHKSLGNDMIFYGYALTKEERKTLWYNGNDYAAFLADVSETLRELKKCNKGNESWFCHDNNTVYCSHGLEHLYLEEFKSFKGSDARNVFRKSIMELQAEQRRIGSVDPDQLQSLSFMLSRNACVCAQKLARKNYNDDNMDELYSRTKNGWNWWKQYCFFRIGECLVQMSLQVVPPKEERAIPMTPLVQKHQQQQYAILSSVTIPCRMQRTASV